MSLYIYPKSLASSDDFAAVDTSLDTPPQAPPLPDPAADTVISHIVGQGETLNELAARYRVPVQDIIDANPALMDIGQINPGETLTIPLQKGGELLPALYSVQSGESLHQIAATHGAGVGEIALANNMLNQDLIYPGEKIWIPGMGGQARPGAASTNGDAVTAAALIPETQKMNRALRQANATQRTLAALKDDAAQGSGAAHAELRDGFAQENADDALSKLKDAVNDAIGAQVGAKTDDAMFNKAGQELAAPYIRDPAAYSLLDKAIAQVHVERQVQAILGGAQAQNDPLQMLRTLNTGYSNAPQNVKDALLTDSHVQEMLGVVAAWANRPLTQKPDNGAMPQAQTVAAIRRLDQATQGLDKILASAVVDRAVPAYEAFYKDPEHGGSSLFGNQGMTVLMNLSGRITGCTQGDDAIARFAVTDAWNSDAVQTAIGAGADPAYAIALASSIKAAGQEPDIVVKVINDSIALRDQKNIAGGGDPQPTLDVAKRLQAPGLDGNGVMKVVTDGMQQFKGIVTADVTKLALHDAEISWLVQNLGPGMTPQQLSQAVADYRTKKGPDWQAEDDKLRQQIVTDGNKLIAQMIAVNQTPQTSGTRALIDPVLQKIVNDPAAGLAISTAIQADPNLTDASHAKDMADLFSLSKIGDIGRKYSSEAASAYLRRNVLAQVQGVKLNDPASVEQAKRAISSLHSENFARLLGVTPSDLDKAVNAVQGAADDMTNATTAEEENVILQNLNKTLNTDATLSKTFNKMTVPGQLLRGVAVAFAGASLINSDNKFNANPSDPQNGIKLLLDSAGFAQKNTEVLIGLGRIDKSSLLGQFGGEWKLFGRASVGDLIGGVSSVLDSVSALRSGFGLGTQQDDVSAALSATTAVGGALTVAPAFGAAAWLGPVGLGVTAAGVIGKVIYESDKDAHKYESASKRFLKSAGYDDFAAEALSKQGGLISDATGASQIPFLAKYGQLKHMTPDQLQKWVNSLSADQINAVANRLQQTASDSSGNPENFIDGPRQTVYIASADGYAAPVTRANTLSVFEEYLKYDHVPLG
ncbi:LysM domain-containing protein [Collimonas sp. PA-H2]|uniref:LysM peptidoglycan-binding domain-containing protein n=1 Tax=Collimonas sp. PA-H2 TaxID=1881062 RepID=UPI000BF776CB|nr:LysM domain-containing protein [Collimonas sp. PA-H2]PFH08640.1 LysM domain-containing protein [Collimonas sp. PA-H2]